MRDRSQPSLGRIYARVLLTYLWRPWPLFWSALIVAGAAFASSPRAAILVLRGAPPTIETLYDNLVISTIFISVTCGHFAAFITDQTSRLLATPHGFLTPRLRGPAIVIAVVLTIGSLCLVLSLWPEPLLPSARPRFPIYAGSIAVLLAAEFAWIQIWSTVSHLGSIPIAAVLIPWWSFVFPSVRHAFVQMVAGERPMLAAALYVIAAILFILLWIVLANRRQVDALRVVPSSAGDVSGAVPSGEMPRLHITASPWQRFRLRRQVTSGGSSDAIVGAWGGVLLTICAVTLQHLYGPNDPGIPLALSLLITVLAPIIVASRTAALRPTMLTYDVLFPQSRRAFAHGHGVAIFANLFAFWSCAQFTLILSYALLAPADLRLYGRSLAILLPVSAAFQVFFFGLLAWYLSYRPSFYSGVALFAVGFGMVPINISFFNRPQPFVTQSLALAGAMLGTGIVLAFTALRRWSGCEIR